MSLTIDSFSSFSVDATASVVDVNAGGADATDGGVSTVQTVTNCGGGDELTVASDRSLDGLSPYIDPYT